MFPASVAQYQDQKELRLKAYVTNIHASKRVHHVQYMLKFSYRLRAVSLSAQG